MSNHSELLQQIYELGFAINDLTLYLDTHPEDMDACAKFHQLMQEKKAVTQEFEANHYPLCLSGMQANKNGWTWGDSPAPWQGGLTNVEL